MRIGELLLERGLVGWDTLALALADQRHSGMRLCSLLVASRLLEFDQASLVLGEQRGSAAVQRRHLVGRDRSVTALLAAPIAKRLCAIPIGRQGNGTLIVCVRDPSPKLHAELARAIAGPIVLAVAPARYVEQLVEHVYTEIDVPIDVEAADDPAFDFEVDRAFDAAIEPDIDIDVYDPDDEPLPIEVELPDEGAPRPPPKPKSRALPVRIKRLSRPPRDLLDTTIGAFREIDDIEWLFDVVMGYVAQRWAAGMIVAIEDKRAVGVRGHGQRLKPSATRAFVMPLSDPSLVQLARDKRRIVDEPPPDAGKRISVTLDNAAQPVAAPLLKSDTVSHVLVVGDPLSGDHDGTLRDLEVLVEALDEALARI
ncbi:MAG TPA: hypothetical protein VIV40_14585 [Kofleriaceae bacterium]